MKPKPRPVDPRQFDIIVYIDQVIEQERLMAATINPEAPSASDFQPFQQDELSNDEHALEAAHCH